MSEKTAETTRVRLLEWGLTIEQITGITNKDGFIM